MRVVERLVTLCGETHLAGTPCALIRFAGCDLACRWCDTTPSQNADAGRDLSVEALLAWVKKTGMRLVMLTGGEPLLQQDLSRLASLLATTCTVLVETSGAHDIRALAPPVIRSVDVKCPGSGQSTRNLWDNLEHLRPGDAVKFVIADRDDYAYAMQVIRRHELGGPLNILLSSAYPHMEPGQLASWIVEDHLVDVRINVQLHRVIWPHLEASAMEDHR